VVPLCVVELTAQLTTSQGSQIAASINEKLRIGDIVFLVRRYRNAAVGSVPRRLYTSILSSNADSVSIEA
jgi:hypothetical protein